MSAPSDPSVDLAAFFVGHFSAEELRIFVSGLPDGAALSAGLPGANATLATLAHEAAGLLVRLDVQRTAAFWSALEASRPRLGEARAALRERLGAGGPGFSGYEVLGTAGRGGSGTVYVVRDLVSRQTRAIKLADPSRGKAERDRLAREYRVLAGLSHPALLRVYHMVQDDSRAWMVCEHLAGGSLDERLRAGRLWTDLELAALGGALASALDLLHSQDSPVIHRDIKPDNILFDADDRPRLIDLGHARVLAPASRTLTRLLSSYVAPELLSPRPPSPNPASDLYSLCAVLRHAALHTVPEAWPETAEALRALIPDRDPRLVDAIIRGCARRPQDRPTSAELARMLGEILESEAEARAKAREEAAANERRNLEAQLRDVEAATAQAQTRLEEAKRQAEEANASREAEAARLRDSQAELEAVKKRAARARFGWGGVLLVGLVGVALGALGGWLAGTTPPERRTPTPQLVAAPAVPSTPTPTPTGSTSTWLTSLNAPMTFIKLSGGTFQMGSLDGVGDPDEHPRHQVTVSGFWMARSEVTQAQWGVVVRAARAAGDADAAGLVVDPSRYKGDTRPVETVSWCAAARFANAVSRLEGLLPAYTVGSDCETGGAVGWEHAASGFRLPTEAEWEYAARAGTQTTWSFGDDPAWICTYDNVADQTARKTHPDYTWSVDCDDGFAETASVCSFPLRPWGLCDMAGNVWEWTWDWYADAYAPGPLTNPGGSADRGVLRVLRGGSWGSRAGLARSASRSGYRPSDADVNLGLRLVLPAVPSER